MTTSKPTKSLRSALITEGLDRAPHRAFLRATGVDEADFGKPFIGIVSHTARTRRARCRSAAGRCGTRSASRGRALPVPFTTSRYPTASR